MARGGQIGQRVERAMELPAGTLSKAALVEVEGDHRAVITGCRGILAYTEDCVRLRTPDGELALYGQGMELGCLTGDSVTVTGCLRRIELAR